MSKPSEGKQEADDDVQPAITLQPVPSLTLGSVSETNPLRPAIAGGAGAGSGRGPGFSIFGSSRRPTPNLNPNALPTGDVTPGQVRFVAPEIKPRPSPKSAPKPSPGIRVTQAERRQALAQFAHEEENLPEFIITQTSFSVWGADEIRKEARDRRIYNPDETGYHTVNDPSMGTVDPRVMCSTCGKDNINCPGHFGYIELNETPVYHPLFLTHIVRVLSSVCNSCGGLLLSDVQIEEEGINKYTGDERLKMIKEKSVGKPCRRSHEEETVLSPGTAQAVGMSPTSMAAQGEVSACRDNPVYAAPKLGEYIQYYYSEEDEEEVGEFKEGEEVIHYTKKGKHQYHTMTPSEALGILDSISDEDAQILGFRGGTHPRNMIIQVLAVMPPCIRNANIREGMVGSDYYGTLYREIIKKHQNYLETNDRKKKDQDYDYIQKAITAIITNYNSPILHVPESFKPIKVRLQDKNKGIFRGMLSGKRVNFSARTVAGPDPALKSNQARLPEEWRKDLTREVIVTDFNYQSLMEMMKNKMITHITPSEGKSKDQQIRVTDNNRDKLSFRPGDKVTRWGQDGDMVLLNRQPTIHKQGIMGHEAVFMPGKTIGLPLAVTTPYNADFDGDEMNVHAVQTIEGVIDILGKMDVRQCILNAQDNKPIIAPVMDSLTSAYKLTQDDVYVDNDLWNDIMMQITANDGLPTLDERLERHGLGRVVDPGDGIDKYSGRALFSAILPPDFFYRKGKVLIIDGVLVSGTLDKSTLGTSHNSIIQVLYKTKGTYRTVDFLTDAPRLLERWLTAVGFTVGLADCNPLDENDRKMVQKEVAKVKAQVKQLGTRLNDPLEEARRETEIAAKTGQAKNLGSRLSEEALRPDNSLNVMARSGAKGSVWNITQITGIVGQQFISGGLAPTSLMQGRRSLAYFKPDEIDPEARGFITHSFMEGITPAEMMFHQAAGREGLIDTANKTAEVGALHRDIVKLLEDIKVAPDGSVRGSNGKLIQAVYGDDGFDGAELQNVKHGEEDMPFFIDLQNVSGYFNAKYGYYPGRE